jgi:hypothetical protein
MHLGTYPYQIWHYSLSEQFSHAIGSFNAELHETTKMPRATANLVTQLLAKHIGPLVDSASLNAARREFLEQLIAMPNEIAALYDGLDKLDRLDRAIQGPEDMTEDHTRAASEMADRVRSILSKMGKVEACFRERDRLHQENEILHAHLVMAMGGFPAQSLPPLGGDRASEQEEIEVDL